MPSDSRYKLHARHPNLLRAKASVAPVPASIKPGASKVGLDGTNDPKSVVSDIQRGFAQHRR